MRTDEGLGQSEVSVDRNSRMWERLLSGASFSGHERNHLFLNQDGDDYVEVSGVSGLDHPGDGRAFGILDYDRDGWQDVAVVNANAPLLQLYRNRMGERDGVTGGVVAVRFQGGSRSSQATDRWSARDGYGARVRLEIDSLVLLREHRAGEGLAAQNSATMHIGVDDAAKANRLEVRWPSGRSYDTAAVQAGTLVTAYENPADSPTGAPFVLSRYGPGQSRHPAAASAGTPRASVRVAHQALSGQRGRLIVYTTVATWCLPCLDELPDFNHLRSAFTTEELEIFGVPYDEEETLQIFKAWSERNAPPYPILTELDLEQRNTVIDAALDALRLEGLPATVVTDRGGEVLLVRWGPPSVSEIRVLLEGLGEAR